jgi:WD40 repeat protein/uncharacterized caspase-like protein
MRSLSGFCPALACIYSFVVCAQTPQLTVQTVHQKLVSSVAISADSRFVVTAGSADMTAKLWELSSGREIRTFSGHSERVSSVAISTDGRYVVTGSYDKTAKLWDLTSGHELRTFSGHSEGVSSVAFSTDGRYVVTGSDDKTAKVWDLSRGQETRTFSGHSEGVSSVGISTDGRYVVTGSCDKTAKLWDLTSGQEIRTFSGHSHYVSSVAISRDARYAVTGSSDDTAKLWDLSSGEEIRTFSGHSIWINSVAISTDGRYVVTGSYDKTAKLWDLNSGEEIRTFSGHSISVDAVAFSPDGKHLLTGDFDGTARLWDLRTGQEIRRFSGHTDNITSVAASTDGRYLLTASGDKTAKLWDLRSGQEIRTFSGHSALVHSVAISADDRYVVTGGRDGKTIIWDLNTGKKLATLVSLDRNDWAVITPDGRFDASPGGMKSMHYAQGLEVLPLESFFEQFYTPALLARVLSGETEPPIETFVDFSNTIKLPPLVKIVSPSQGQSFTADEVQITVEVSDQGGGIDEVRLYHNGKLISEEQRGVKILTSKEAKLVERYDVNLVAGLNEFKVTALNMDRTESIPATLTIELKAGESAADLYILSIGINQYKNSKLNLNYGRPDAEAFLKVVEEKAKGIFRQIFTYAIYDSDATKATIERAFARIIVGSSAQDGFVFFYAGHGVMSEGDTSTKPDFYFVPTGVTQLYGNNQTLSSEAISATALRGYCRKIQAQKQLIVIDACQAGGAVETFAVRGAAEQKAIAQLARSAGVVVLAATSTEQFATEFKQLSHGVFTYALLQGLEGEADGSPKDSKVTVAELKAYLDDQIPELTRRYRGQAQYPMAYMRGQDFPVGIAK